MLVGYQTEMDDVVDAAESEVGDALRSSVLPVVLVEHAPEVVADLEEVFEGSGEAAHSQLVEAMA